MEVMGEKKVIIQGWECCRAAYYLTQAGAIIVGIIDKVGGVLNYNGYSLEEIIMLENRTSNFLEMII